MDRKARFELQDSSRFLSNCLFSHCGFTSLLVGAALMRAMIRSVLGDYRSLLPSMKP